MRKSESSRLIFSIVSLSSCTTQSVLGWQQTRRHPLSNGRLLQRQQQHLVHDHRSMRGRGAASAALAVSSSSKNEDPIETNHERQRPIQRHVSSLLSRVGIWKRAHHEGQTSVVQQQEIASELERLKRENALLRQALEQLEAENELMSHTSNRIVLETFEGEGKIRRSEQEWHNNATIATPTMTMTESEMISSDDSSLWCDELEEDNSCPIEPNISFTEALRDRALWLVGLLVMQSASGLILARHEALLGDHPVIVYFLTMLVGAGGNAGNQASVRVIRGLALGTLNEQTQNQFLTREFRMAIGLSTIISIAGFVRAAVFQTPFPETIAVTAALALIVFSSVCLGAVLPLILKRVGVDPAHSSTTIQVVMDILGVLLCVFVASILLDSPLGHALISWLSGRNFGRMK